MIRIGFFFLCIYFSCQVYGQKKPLDHNVYDSWQSVGERMISNNGKWVLYSINPQEGDNQLVIQSADGNYKKIVPRGYNAIISEDSRYAIFKIRPPFKDSREARIKKKKPDEMPKDSLAIVELGIDSMWKIGRVKNFKTPEKESGWVAFHMEKPVEKKEGSKKMGPEEKRIADSLNRVIDSLRLIISSNQEKKKRNKDDEGMDAEGDDQAPAVTDAGTDLVIRNLRDGKEKLFTNVLEYLFSKRGGKLVIEQARNPKDSLSKSTVQLFDLVTGNTITLSKGGNEFRNFGFSEDGSQLAYLAERDAKPKELQKFFKLWYYRTGMDSATLLIDKTTVGMKLGRTISEHGNLSFSKKGNRLFFGTSPIQPAKDTSLVEIDLVKVDIWHYKDDYLQTQQLSRLPRDQQLNYLAVYHLDKGVVKILGDEELPQVIQTDEGDGERFVGITDFGKRVEAQWTGTTRKDIYAIDPVTGTRKLVKKDMLGIISAQYISPSGKYIVWYDSKLKNYFAWDGDSARNISRKIKVPLWNEEHDSPSDPAPYGVMKWDDKENVLIYDRYAIWKLDPLGRKNPVALINQRKERKQFRYISVDPEERFLKTEQKLLLRSFDQVSKKAGLWMANYGDNLVASGLFPVSSDDAVKIDQVVAADSADAYIFTKESYSQSPDLFFKTSVAGSQTLQLSAINPQQQRYNWGTASLYKWKALNGKMAEGILYKPENFDPNKKYPLIFYFYETHSNDLNDYMAPSPTASRLNIPFFVSRGYLVFSPDIRYTIGHPARSAYNYVVGAAKDLARHKWVDAKNMGIQGQSWGGIQVAQLITMTDIFKAAWAGAPVANMTSAYGGIRWESGLNRQFQYEKTQSRIGATLWEKPSLYIENSPLFHVPRIKTPLVIMHNDADGAVPWYQGIELFTAMRRLGKKVWLLNYNGEAHNLVERKNRKDIQVREQQFFDWLLKGEAPAKWLTEGVPAVKKGKDWGLELVH